MFLVSDQAVAMPPRSGIVSKLCLWAATAVVTVGFTYSIYDNHSPQSIPPDSLYEGGNYHSFDLNETAWGDPVAERLEKTRAAARTTPGSREELLKYLEDYQRLGGVGGNR